MQQWLRTSKQSALQQTDEVDYKNQKQADCTVLSSSTTCIVTSRCAGGTEPDSGTADFGAYVE